MGSGRTQKFRLLVIFTTKIIDAIRKPLSFVNFISLFLHELLNNDIHLDITVVHHRLHQQPDRFIAIYGNKKNTYLHCLETNQMLRNLAMEKQVNKRPVLNSQMKKVTRNQTIKIQKLQQMTLKGNQMMEKLMKNYSLSNLLIYKKILCSFKLSVWYLYKMLFIETMIHTLSLIFL